MNERRSTWHVALVLLATIAATGCRAPVVLMPTPEVLRDERFDLFAERDDPQALNRITTFFASNRKPKAEGSATVFGAAQTESLTLGRVTFQVGGDEVDWRDLYAQSATGERSGQFELNLVEATLDAQIDLPADGSSREAQAFFAQLNQALADREVKDLTVFVHGANNSFVESVARGANFQYFTGDRAVVLTFAWPSAGSIMGYFYDKRSAEGSPQQLAAFLELLAANTRAERINAIGYSAGGRVLGGALALLGASYSSADAGAELRLGQMYMASSDEPLVDFAERLPGYAHLVDAITVMTEPDDSVLRLAALVDGKLRLGSPPAEGDALALSEEAHERLTDWLNSGKLVVLNLQINEIEGFEYSHSAWYENPWVSSDVLVTMYVGLPPAKRGLGSYRGNRDRTIWYFPANYVDELRAALLAHYPD